MPTESDDLLIKGKSKPGVLRISDNFGKEAKIFSIVGDMAIQLFADPLKQISGSLVIHDQAGKEILRIKQDGELMHPNRKENDPNTISQTKNYSILVIDEVGNQKFIKVSGKKLAALLK